MRLSTEGNTDNYVYVEISPLDGGAYLLSKRCRVGGEAKISIDVAEYGEFKLTIVKESGEDKFTLFEIHSAESPSDLNSENAPLPEAGEEGGCLVEIPQDQGKQYDDFSRTTIEKCEGYTLYTANADLQIAFKMMNIDVTDCDYVVVKFAEPVAGGWNLAFWEGTSLASVAEGTSEYRFELEPAMASSGKLPQLCMMTFFGGYTAPLVAKVEGVYKHSTVAGLRELTEESSVYPTGYINLDGIETTHSNSGFNIERLSNGKRRKIIRR